MTKINSLLAIAVLGMACSVNADDATGIKNNFTLLHDLTVISVKDSGNRDWDGGCYTQNPIVKIGYDSKNPDISSVRLAVEKCNGIVRANHTYTYLEDAIATNSTDIEITNIAVGETAEFDVSVPGRYCLGYCVLDNEDKIIIMGRIPFDSLYDDGNWSLCGDAEVSSGILSSDNLSSHDFRSNGTGFLEEPGDFIWYECPVVYPYYLGETWSAPIEYHSGLKMYRIVNPFTYNSGLKDYFPADDELLCATYNNVAYTPEAFIFDHENPAWWLLNAESEYFTYCEPMRTGLVACHHFNPYCYTAHPYNENIGYVRYNVCPVQDIKTTGTYVDMPLDDEREASIIVKFPGWTSGVDEISDDRLERKEYFTVDGSRTLNPWKGIHIVKQGIKASKIVF